MPHQPIPSNFRPKSWLYRAVCHGSYRGQKTGLIFYFRLTRWNPLWSVGDLGIVTDGHSDGRKKIVRTNNWIFIWANAHGFAITLCVSMVRAVWLIISWMGSVGADEPSLPFPLSFCVFFVRPQLKNLNQHGTMQKLRFFCHHGRTAWFVTVIEVIKSKKKPGFDSSQPNHIVSQSILPQPRFISLFLGKFTIRICSFFFQGHFKLPARHTSSGWSKGLPSFKEKKKIRHSLFALTWLDDFFLLPGFSLDPGTQKKTFMQERPV